MQIIADPAVERGGCWLETEQGEVDATVDGRLARLAAALDEVRIINQGSVPDVDWGAYRRQVAAFDPIQVSGRVTQVVGLVVEFGGPGGAPGRCLHNPSPA